MTIVLLLVACAPQPGTPATSDTGTPVTETGDTGAGTACGDAAGTLPDGLVELVWDDGNGQTSVAEQEFSVVGYPLNDVALHEAVRFDLDRPARVHGFAIEYGQLPDDPEAPVAAGLYPDFGHNGFDFWQWDPLWRGTRCAGDLTADAWATFVFDEPVEVAHPGLVYVAHRRDAATDPSWNFDVSTTNEDGSCGGFDDCHSAMNLPELQTFEYGGQGYYAYNGLSFPFQYDYVVRLYVEYTDEVAPEDTVFQPVDGVSVSSRSSWGDYDGDGWDDLYTGGTLYRNGGDGSFTDVTAAAGLSGLSSSGGTWGDYDDDGCLDLVVFAESYTAGETLMRNLCDGTFVDVTAAAGITDVQAYNDCAASGDRAPSPAASWWDVDADGRLDLYVVGFICWTDYTYYTDQVWHNEGDGTFADWTGERGFLGYDDERYAGRGANPVDVDRDGDVDLAVNDYVLHRNLYYDNQGDGTVVERAVDAGLAGRVSTYGRSTYYGHTIGTAFGDLDNDGDFDAVQANLAHPRYFDFSSKTEVLLNDGAGTFADIQGDWTAPMGDAGLRYQETHSVPVLGDFDHDGVLDLAITCVYDGRPTDFYWGVGDGTFVLDSFHAGLDVESGWGMAAADYDHDGDLDLATSGGLYRNDGDGLGRWLQVRVTGGDGVNRAALGATVAVTAGGTTRIRSIPGGSAQGNQDSLVAHFGLGEEATVDAIEVTFPGGRTESYAGPFDADQRVTVGVDGRVATGW